MSHTANAAGVVGPSYAIGPSRPTHRDYVYALPADKLHLALLQLNVAHTKNTSILADTRYFPVGDCALMDAHTAGALYVTPVDARSLSGVPLNAATAAVKNLVSNEDAATGSDDSAATRARSQAVRAKILAEDAKLRSAYPLLSEGWQSWLALAVWVVALAAMICVGAAYVAGRLPALVVIPTSAFAASLLHELVRAYMSPL